MTVVYMNLIADSVQAIRDAIEERVDIINMSIGFTRIDDNSGIRQAIKDANSADILAFAAASNEATSMELLSLQN